MDKVHATIAIYKCFLSVKYFKQKNILNAYQYVLLFVSLLDK